MSLPVAVLARRSRSRLVAAAAARTTLRLQPQSQPHAASRIRTRLASTSVSPLEQQPMVVPTPDEIANDVQLAGLGYPQLPQVSRQLRPAKNGWWDPQERVNFNETLPENDDTLSMWAPDVHKKPAHLAAAQFALASGVMAAFALLLYTVGTEAPAAKRTYPYDGLVKELSGTDDQTYAAVINGKVGGEDEDEAEDDE